MNDSDSNRRKGEVLALAERFEQKKNYKKNVGYVEMDRKTKLDEQNKKKAQGQWKTNET